MLSEIAFKTFEKGEYFFKQKRVENLILEFIQNLPDTKNDPKALRLDSEHVLKTIESQHGILVERAKGLYSFSHLTFQEYLAAMYMTTQQALYELIPWKLDQSRWYEVVILFFAEMNSMSANSHVAIKCKEMIDKKLYQSENVKDLLLWIRKKELSISLNEQIPDEDIKEVSNYLGVTHNKAAVNIYIRYYYLNLILFNEGSLGYLDSPSIAAKCIPIDIYLYEYLFVQTVPDYKENFLQNIAIADIQMREFGLVSAADELQKIKEQFSVIPLDEEKKWYAQKEYTEWQNTLRSWMKKYRDMDGNWDFDSTQQETLQSYLWANELLLKSLRSTYIRRDVREWIETTMFLPISELETMTPPEI